MITNKIIGKIRISDFIKAALLLTLIVGVSLTGCKTVRKAAQRKTGEKQRRRRKRLGGIRTDRARSEIRIVAGYPTSCDFLLAAILRNLEPTVRDRMESPPQQPVALR